MDDTELAEMLGREWRARSEQVLEISNVRADALREALGEDTKRLESDVIIFPSAMLGELAEGKRIRPIPRQLTAEPTYSNAEVFDLVRRRETHWGQYQYAVSLGSPVLMLMRRTDFVPDAPATWNELSEQIASLRTTLPEDVMPIAQPLADGWAARLLLARAAAYVHDDSRVSGVFDYATMEPRISLPPFQRALRELTLDAQGSRLDLTPAAGLESLLRGNAALAITWPSSLGRDVPATQVDLPIAISELPGATFRYDAGSDQWVTLQQHELRRVTLFGGSGRLGAVSRSAKNAALAGIFLGWATSPEQSIKISPASAHTGPYRESQLADAAAWVDGRLSAELARDYAEAVVRALSRAAAIQSPRLPKQHEYMSLLNDAVLRAAQHGADPMTTLEAVARAWSSVVKQDLDQQKTAYRRSLGIDFD